MRLVCYIPLFTEKRLRKPLCFSQGMNERSFMRGSVSCDIHFSSGIMTTVNIVSFLLCCNIETKGFRNMLASTVREGSRGHNKLGLYASLCAPFGRYFFLNSCTFQFSV